MDEDEYFDPWCGNPSKCPWCNPEAAVVSPREGTQK